MERLKKRNDVVVVFDADPVHATTLEDAFCADRFKGLRCHDPRIAHGAPPCAVRQRRPVKVVVIAVREATARCLKEQQTSLSTCPRSRKLPQHDATATLDW